MVIISLTDSTASTPLTYTTAPIDGDAQKSRLAVGLWLLLAIVMVSLYLYFN
jgi:hypothetical protein